MVLPARITTLFSLAALAGLFVTVIAIVSLPPEKSYLLHTGDFPGFYVLAVIVQRGLFAQLYALPLQEAIQHEFFPALGNQFNPSLYPPWTALLLAPLSLVPPSIAKSLFCILNLSLYLTAYTLICSHVRTYQKVAPLTLGAVPLLLMCSPVFSTLLGAQNSGITTALLCACYLCLARNTSRFDLLAGCAAALLLYKPQFGLFAGLFFFLLSQRKLFFTIGFTATALLLLLSALYFFPTHIWEVYFQTLQFFDAQNLQVNRAEAVSLRAISEMIGLYLFPQALSTFRNAGTLLCLTLTCIGALTVFIQTTRCSPEKRPEYNRKAYTWFLLLLPLLSPQTLWYDLSISMMALFLLNASEREKMSHLSYLLLMSFFCLSGKENHIPLSFLPFHFLLLFCATRVSK
jgi:hypothetical protein